MKIGKPIIAGLMGLTTIAPCKAQKSVNLVSETGISGLVNKEASFYTGLNFEIPRGKNYADFYGGISVNPEKKASFVGLAIENYAWHKHLSSWGRETFVASNRNVSSTLEIAPVRANANAGRFNFSISPSYALYNNFKGADKGAKQGINTILQMVYKLSKKETFFVEAKYSTEPAKNLFNTSFGKPKNNTSYMASYLLNL